MRLLMMAVACAVAASSLSVARADEPMPPSQSGLCAACHGTHGPAQIAGLPNLAGQRVDYLRAAWRQYRDGQRNVPLMRTALGPLSDAQLDVLATRYSQQSTVAQGQS